MSAFGPIELTTGAFPTDGFTFGILGPTPSDGTDAPVRSQGNNYLFTQDYTNVDFVAGVVYRLQAYHPTYMPQIQYIDGSFDANGNWIPQTSVPTSPGGSDSAFVGLQSASEGQLTTTHILPNGQVVVIPTALNTVFLAMLNGASPDVLTKFCQIVSNCELPGSTLPVPTFDNFQHFQFTLDQGALPDAYMLRLDFNSCGTAGAAGDCGGWIANTNHPGTAAVVRVTRDGVFFANVTADRARPDVRDYLAAQGIVTTSATLFGWYLTKSLDDNDGKAHTYRFFGDSSTTEATSDTGALNTITCGTAVATVDHYREDVTTDIAAGATGNLRITSVYTDATEKPYTGGGTYAIADPKPALVLTSGASATATIANPVGYVGDSLVFPTFTFPVGSGINQIPAQILLRSYQPALDAKVIANPGGGYQVQFMFRCSGFWQYAVVDETGYAAVYAQSSEASGDGYLYGINIAPSGGYSIGNTINIFLKAPGGFVVARTLTISGLQARTSLWLASDLALAGIYGTTASASSSLSGYPASKAIDGLKGNYSTSLWSNSTTVSGTVNEHLDVDLKLVRSLQRVIVYSLPDDYAGRTTPVADGETFTHYGLVAFRVQVPNGSGGWTTIATVAANNQVKRTVTFSAVNASTIRIQVDGIVSGDTYVRILEVEAYSTLTD